MSSASLAGLPPASYDLEADHSEAKRLAAGALPVRFRLAKHPAMFAYSVSGQPYLKEYPALLARLAADGLNVNPEHLLIANLRLEGHCYVNVTESVTFPEEAGQHSTTDLIALLIANREKGRPLSYWTAHGEIEPLTVESFSTEEALLRDLNENIHFVRIGVEDHKTPDDAAVDYFIGILRSRAAACPEIRRKLWIHIHCHGGKGRSSLFAAILVLVELKMQNKLSDIKPLKEILDEYLDKESCERLFPKVRSESRSSLLTLSPLTPRSSTISLTSLDRDTTADNVAERVALLEKFLAYARDQDPSFKGSWAASPRNIKEQRTISSPFLGLGR